MTNASKLAAAIAAGIAMTGCAEAIGPDFGAGDDDDAGEVGEGATAGEAARLEPVEYSKDGTVVVGDERFETVQAFHRSAEFRDSGRRCAAEPPDAAPAFDPSDCSFTFTSIQPEYQPDATYEIPVVFHIIQREDGTGFVPEERIRSQLEVLNEDFQALPNGPGAPGVNAEIRFVFAEEDPQGNPTDAINYYTNDDWYRDSGPGRTNEMKETIAWDTERYFNIYTNDASGALGYATFPTQSAGTPEDGIVLLHTSVGKDAPDGGDFDQGRTGTHEVGHYLGLFHTFQDGCGSADSPYSSGDRLADTPAHSGPNFQCDPQPSSCSGESGDRPIENYMNYTPDACMNRFTSEQANRMRCSMIHYRQELYTVVDDGGTPAPEAGFELSATDLEVSFTDTSSQPDGSISSWSWSFGDGATSTEQNPTHTYAEAGEYTVQLEVTGEGGAADRATQTVVVTETPSTSGELTSGEAVSGLRGGDGEELRFFLDVPEGAAGVSFELRGGAGATGDADLYVLRGAEPTQSNYACRPFEAGNDETCQQDAPEAGRWHVMVRGWTTFENVELVATIAGDEGGGFEDEISDLAGPTGDTAHFEVDVPAGASDFVVETTGGTGDVDVYVRRGSAPTVDEWDYRPYRYGNDERVQIDEPAADRWHIMLHGYETYEGVTLRMRFAE